MTGESQKDENPLLTGKTKRLELATRAGNPACPSLDGGHHDNCYSCPLHACGLSPVRAHSRNYSIIGDNMERFYIFDCNGQIVGNPKGYRTMRGACREYHGRHWEEIHRRFDEKYKGELNPQGTRMLCSIRTIEEESAK